MKFTSLLYPSRCMLCGESIEENAHGICPECRMKARYEASAIYCQMPIAGIDGIVCAGNYARGLKQALCNMKFQSQRVYVQPLAELMIQAWKQRGMPQPTMITCVPISLTRSYRRGFNQSALLAQAISKAWGIPFQETLRRRILSKKQSTLHAQQRRENAAKAFSPRTNVDLSGKQVLLIDDIITTGSTIQACGELLRKMGADKIYVLAAARAGA